MAVILMLLCLMAAMGLGAGAVLVWQQRHGPLAAAPQPTATKPAHGASTAASSGPQRNVTSGPLTAERSTSSDRAFDPKPGDRETVVDRKSSRSDVASGAAANDSKAAMPAQMGSDMRSADAMVRKADVAPPEPGNKAKAADDDPQQAASVRQSLKEVRDALALGDLERVDELLDLGWSRHRAIACAEIAGVRTLCASVGSFWNAVRESLKTVNSGTELEIDGDTIIVVEVSRDRDRLAIRSKGQNGNYLVKQLPADLAAGLAVRWLDKDDVNSPAFVGAYLATTARQEYVARGRAMLEKAQAAGSDVARAVLDALE